MSGFAPNGVRLAQNDAQDESAAGLARGFRVGTQDVLAL